MSWKTNVRSAGFFFFIVAQFVTCNAQAQSTPKGPGIACSNFLGFQECLSGGSLAYCKWKTEQVMGPCSLDAASAQAQATTPPSDQESEALVSKALYEGRLKENSGDLEGALAAYTRQLQRLQGLDRSRQTTLEDARSDSIIQAIKDQIERITSVKSALPRESTPTPVVQVPPPAPNLTPTTVTPPATSTSTAKIDLGRRVALVIGNGRYEHAAELPNPRNDAQAIAAKLRAVGFTDVQELHDLNLAALSGALKNFGDRAASADWAVIYYAGHGIEVGGTNYLIPTDARLLDASHVEDEAITLTRLLSKVEGARKMRLVMLDACRENPFAQNMRSAKGSTRSIGRGLASIEPAGGVLVAYAARDGQLAADGDGVNSPFASAIIDMLEQPGLEINLFFRRVRDVVMQRTGLKQEPFTYGSLPAEEFYFAPPIGTQRPDNPLPDTSAELARLRTELEALKKANQQPDASAEAKRKEEERLAMRAEEERRAREGARAMSPGSVFRDCEDKDASGNFICPEVVVVRAGEFMMGSPASEEPRSTNEGPQRTVKIPKPFAVGKFEVTFAEWDACVTVGGCTRVPSDETWGRGRRPVINVSWEDATAYTTWLSKKTGKTYRLLSEAEWEYAARGGTTTRYAFGDSISKQQAQFSEGRFGSAGKTVDVGTFKPNAFGLYDMHGNVMEWVEDCYYGSYQGAPTNGSASKSGDCSLRALRGGSWNLDPASLRVALRSWNPPGDRNRLLGFRLARALEP